MIQVTDAAMAICSATVKHLAGAQTNSKCLRLLKNDGAFLISFELPRVEDTIVHHAGQSVLAIPDEVADDLVGKTLGLANDGRFVIS